MSTHESDANASGWGDYHNAVRSWYGQQPLTDDPELTAAAEARAWEIAYRRFSRYGEYGELRLAVLLDGTSWDARRRLGWIGENIARTSPGIDPLAVWLASPEHRENILCPLWTHIGVGVVCADDDVVHTVIIFGASQ